MKDIVKEWLRSGIPAVFGLLIGLYVSSYEADIADNRFFLEKQAATADTVAQYFSDYIENWRRVRQLRENYKKQKFDITDDEEKHFRSVLVARNEAKDRLFSALDASVLYFSADVSALSEKFQRWDNQQSDKRAHELPDLSEWNKHSRSILAAIRVDLVK